MIGPPALKLWMKKFLSSSLIGVALGLGEAVAVGEVAVVVAGDIPGTVAVAPATGVVPGTAGVVPGTAGVVPGTAGDVMGAVTGAVAAGLIGAVAGLVAVVGGAAGARFAGDVAGGGGGWPNELSARVTETRLAMCSVFIGLIREFSRPRFPMSSLSS
jgi:hypothetical protein